MKSNQNNFKKMSRTFYLLAILFALPFILMRLENVLENPRQIASDGSSAIAFESADLTEISNSDFLKAFKYQVLKNAHLETTSSKNGILLNAVYVKNEHGAKVFVCEKYSVIEIIFAAEGVAISGETPEVRIQGECLISEDFQYISPLMIPSSWKELSQQTALTAIRTHDDKSLPPQWTWSGVRFIDPISQEILEISSYEIMSVLGTDIVIPLTITE